MAAFRKLVCVLALVGCGGTASQGMVTCSPTHSSVLGGTPERCDSSFSCFDSGTMKHATYDVQCTRTGGSGDWSCDCIENGVKVKPFASIDYCTGNNEKAAAATACGWRLE
jgi:hypothetical protein